MGTLGTLDGLVPGYCLDTWTKLLCLLAPCGFYKNIFSATWLDRSIELILSPEMLRRKPRFFVVTY